MLLDKLVPNWLRRAVGMPEDETEQAERAQFDPSRRRFVVHSTAGIAAMAVASKTAPNWLPPITYSTTPSKIIAPAQAAHRLVAPQLTDVVKFGNGPQFDTAAVAQDVVRKLYYKIGRTWFENEVGLNGEMKTVRTFNALPPGVTDCIGFPEPQEIELA